MATIDKYTLSTTLNDEDLFLIAKYDSSTAQYVDYNKYKVTLDENVSAHELLDKYEILSREGEIFTIKEIEVDEE